MAWLKSVFGKADARQQQVATLDKSPLAPSKPLLAVLEPDTGGVSSFRLRGFYSTEEASAYLQALMPQLRRGVYPFWALHTQPVSAEDLKVEATVLIRANQGSDLVYIVSFLDLESAYSFTRFEVKRGLHLENVMIYWAVFAEAVEEANGIAIYPSEAPVVEPMQPWQAEVRNQVAAAERIALEPPVVERAPEPVIERAPEPIVDRTPSPEPVVERAPQKAWSDEEDALQAVERYLQKAQAEELGEAEVAMPTQTQPAVEEEEEVGLWPQATERAIEEPVVEEPVAEIASEYAEPEAALRPEVVTEEEVDAEPLWPEAVVTPVIETPTAEPVAEIEGLVKIEAGGPMWPEAQIEEPVAEIVAEPVAEAVPEVTPAPIEEEIVVDDEAELEALKQAYVFHHEPVEHAPESIMANENETQIESSAAAVVSDVDPATAPPELDRGFADTPVQTSPGDEEDDDDVAKWQQPDPELPSTYKRLDDFDVAYEVERLLKNREWDKRDGPFSGFKSPPGRF